MSLCLAAARVLGQASSHPLARVDGRPRLTIIPHGQLCHINGSNPWSRCADTPSSKTSTGVHPTLSPRLWFPHKRHRAPSQVRLTIVHPSMHILVGSSLPTASSLAHQALRSLVHTSVRLPLERLYLPIGLRTRTIPTPTLPHTSIPGTDIAQGIVGGVFQVYLEGDRSPLDEGPHEGIFYLADG
jgi:hypothetical protein